MEESLTISKKIPELKSMQYETLRQLGVRHIQELAGKLWTDYNSHDPGITMLEVMSYVITDLGFRVNYDIKDILAQQLKNADPRKIQNFYTAGEILPNYPVTKNDFRKLMMDVEVVDDTDEECKYAGVKNAWIEPAENAEHKIYVNHSKSELSLDEVPLPSGEDQDCYDVKALYNVLFEFDACDRYGDLNSNTIEKELVIYEHDSEPELNGLKFNIKIEFPRWDNKNIDWEDQLSVQAQIIMITVKIFKLPSNYKLTPFITNKKEVILKGNKEISGTVSAIADLALIIDAINNFIYDPVDGLLPLYVQKVFKIHEIVEEVMGTLHANRNLCDDYFRFHALKVEEILLCTDIEIDPTADVETVEARIFHEISKSLSPKVNFYTLEEMLNKCRNANQYQLSGIKKFKKTFTVNQKLIEDLNKDDVITLLDAGTNNGEYTVLCVTENKDNPEYTDIQVVEEVDTIDYDEGAYLFKGTIDDTLCLTVDKIFEGPKLKHGFIDDEELNAAERMEYIRVSDLVKIIMDVEGVLAVRSIQIANRPLDNSDEIPSKSVRWCLKLAMNKNYVPRLNLEDSKITFFKDQLPYHAKRKEVHAIIDTLQDSERPQKIRYPKIDIPIPTGEYMDIEKYTSLMEEFPQVYGVGSQGIPGLEALKGDKRTVRLTEVDQLKGFLMFFDQILANYLSQLSHVKDLFSMNGKKDKFGNYLIDKTYFSQPLYNVISHLDPLYVDKSGHLVKLQEIVEDQQLYEKRRNKFLDHLLGRFAETFTDYALLSYKISRAKAPEELIEDKLKFLSDYPDLSRSRGKGFNYLDLCKNWHVDNFSGLEKRASLLTGIEEWTLDKLVFTNKFKVIPDGDQYKAHVEDGGSNVLLVTPLIENEIKVKEHLEKLVINGGCRENYEIIKKGDFLHFELTCDGILLGNSFKTYTIDGSGNAKIEANQDIDTLIEVIKHEYLENPESNRKNLTCPLLNYFNYNVTTDMTPLDPEAPTFTITYTLFSKSLDYETENALLEGEVTREATVGDSLAEVQAKGEAYVHEALWNVINNGSSRGQYSFDQVTSPYKFTIIERYGEGIAHSIEADFNDKIENEVTSLSSGKVDVFESTGNDGQYTVAGGTAEGAFVSIEVDPAPPSIVSDGKLSWTEVFTILTADLETRELEIGTDITPYIEIGDKISINGSSSNDANYTILSLNAAGAGTLIGVKEPLSESEELGDLTYTKTFEIVEISGSDLVIKGNEDEEAVSDLIAFIVGKFFSHEGMHVLEHVLLRPRINEMLFVEPQGEVLRSGLTPMGKLYFQKSVPIVSASVDDSQFKINGDFTSEIKIESNDIIHIDGGSFNDGQYKVKSITFDGTDTVVTTVIDVGPILFDLPDAPHLNGNLIFVKGADIDSVEPSNNKIIITDTDALNLVEGSNIQISGSEDNLNDRRYKALSVVDNSGNIEIVFGKVEERVQDALLPVHLDQDCETCQHVDPYSYVVSVVLPYWPERFINLDFRKFMNKTIRLEGPAHVMFNICWISCEHMAEFEKKYKIWLNEIGKDEPDKVKLAQSLAEFIEILTRIRNVYPTGTLHDCEQDESLEGAIILNNSVLGTF